ncbi:unnamed protein product [Rhizophagus irregularis]|nr:unnamed protein product [Rhizophagus irregularis]
MTHNYIRLLRVPISAVLDITINIWYTLYSLSVDHCSFPLINGNNIEKYIIFRGLWKERWDFIFSLYRLVVWTNDVKDQFWNTLFGEIERKRLNNTPPVWLQRQLDNKAS